MTYKELADKAKMECGVVTELSWLTPKLLLGWISDAMQQYQIDTGVKTCSEEIRLLSTSKDGKYNLGCNVLAVDEITFSPTLNPRSYKAVVRTPLNSFHQIIQWWPDYNQQIQPNNWFYDYTLDTNQIYAAIQGSTLFVFPYTTTGYVLIHYKTAMTPYAPSDLTNWMGYGDDPTQAMSVNHIPVEFNAALTGIRAYVKCKIVETLPNGIREYGLQYAGWKQDIFQGERNLRRNNVDYLQDTEQPTSLGPLF